MLAGTKFSSFRGGGSGGGTLAFADITGIPGDNAALAAALAAKLNLTGGTLTGALAVTPGTLATTGLRLAQTFNAAGTTCRALEVAVTDTACAADSTIARFLGGASGTTPMFAVSKTGTDWFATSGHYIQIDNSVTLPRLRAGFSSSPRGAILFNAGGAGVAPCLLSTGDCFFGRGPGLDNSPNASTAFRGYAQSFSSLTFTFSATNKDEAGAYTGAGHNVEFVGGRGSTQGTGAAGGTASLIGGAAAGSGNNNGGNVIITGGAPTGSGTRGNVLITNLPTSSAGLPTGAIWNNLGVLTIA
jgi:hypothetical protein